jgi:hypothetical protein
MMITLLLRLAYHLDPKWTPKKHQALQESNSKMQKGEVELAWNLLGAPGF